MKLETGNKSAGNGSKKNKKILKKEKAEKLENNRKGQSLQKLVTKHPHFSFLTNGKIKCQITNHQMEPSVENFNNYLKSKSYRRGVQSQYDISEYEEYLVPHKDSEKLLFCQLTGAKVSKKKSAIEKHVKGRKFLRRLQQVQNQGEQQSQEGDQLQGEQEQESQNSH